MWTPRRTRRGATPTPRIDAPTSRGRGVVDARRAVRGGGRRGSNKNGRKQRGVDFPRECSARTANDGSRITPSKSYGAQSENSFGRVHTPRGLEGTRRLPASSTPASPRPSRVLARTRRGVGEPRLRPRAERPAGCPPTPTTRRPSRGARWRWRRRPRSRRHLLPGSPVPPPPRRPAISPPGPPPPRIPPRPSCPILPPRPIPR